MGRASNYKGKALKEIRIKALWARMIVGTVH